MNVILAELFRMIVSLSLSGSILAVGLLLIKLLFKQKLSASWHYYLWFVLILRLVIPFTPQSSLNVFNFLPYHSPTTGLSQVLKEVPSIVIPQLTNNNPNSVQESPLTGDHNTNASSSPTTDTYGITFTTLAILWSTGVLAILFYILLVNSSLFLKFKKQPTCSSKDIVKLLEESKSRLKIHTKVSVVYDVGLKSPALLGWIKPKIIISPQIIDKLSPEELQYVFLHELSHLKRRDLLVNTLVTLIQVVYWFNPFIWYALHHMKQDCEIACDATALATVNPEEHKKYAQTIIELMQLLAEPHWIPGTIGFVSKFNARRIIMISSFKKTTLKWTIAALALTLVVGCSGLTTPLNSTGNNPSHTENPPTASQQNSAGTSPTPTPTSPTPTPTASTPVASSSQPTDSTKALLLNMTKLAQQGKVINSDFPVKTSTIEDIEKVLGKADTTEYVAAAKGRYATYSSHKLVFGINKGEQIFETRSYDNQLRNVSLGNVKAVLGTPAYDTKYNGQEIIGYTAGPQFKIEMVFSQPTTSIPDPVIDHYSVLYPQGTVNSMADDPGRQW
ncbi:M56 family metallopeptidase [Desulfosporosinus sp. OT]|uniref:M56 family metallopeptidase n=1 Tax=Desulfosporosinus sp. OT TaxID=913865 RepID=UPI0003026C73|nr:M56 family metallopeptidase [Desulfosporosinus sp. OT]